MKKFILNLIKNFIGFLVCFLITMVGYVCLNYGKEDCAYVIREIIAYPASFDIEMYVSIFLLALTLRLWLILFSIFWGYLTIILNGIVSTVGVGIIINLIVKATKKYDDIKIAVTNDFSIAKSDVIGFVIIIIILLLLDFFRFLRTADFSSSSSKPKKQKKQKNKFEKKIKIPENTDRPIVNRSTITDADIERKKAQQEVLDKYLQEHPEEAENIAKQQEKLKKKN